MKPIRLEIEGLNSFENIQKIDFKTLTSRGLFGIFGATGSGKSTILDAITLALYGKISRDSTNYINTNCNEVVVTYEFEILSEGKRRNYTVTRCIKRDKNGGLKTQYAGLIENNTFPKAEGTREVNKSCEEIIGLSCEDFTRSVVLPQGKFSEFLRLKGVEKRNMLERIFDLEKYGNKIMQKVKKRRHYVIKERDILTGELKRYKDLTEESYEELRKRLEFLVMGEENLKKEVEETSKKYDKLKKLRDLTKEFYEYKKKEEELNYREKNIEKDRIKLIRGKASIKVKPFIDEYEFNSKKSEENEKYLKKIEKELVDKEIDLGKIEREYKEIEINKNEKLPKLIVEEENGKRALEVYKKYVCLIKERDELLDQYKIYKENIDDKQNKLKSIEVEIKQNEEEEENINKKIEELSYSDEHKELLELSLILQKEYNNFSKQLKEKEDKKQERLKRIEELESIYIDICESETQKLLEVEKFENKKRILMENCPGNSKILLEIKDEIGELSEKVKEWTSIGKKLEELEDIQKGILGQKLPLYESTQELESKVKNLDKELEKLEEDISQLTRDKMAFIIAKELKKGETCPVCGSICHEKHIESVNLIDINNKEEQQKKFKKNKEDLVNNLNKNISDLRILNREEELITEDIRNYREKFDKVQLKETKEKLDNKILQFQKLQFDIENFERENKKIEDILKKLYEEKESIFAKGTKLGETIRGEKKSLKELTEEILSIKTKTEQLFEELIIYKRQLDIECIEKEWSKVKDKEKEISLLREQLKKYIDRRKNILSNKEELNKQVNIYSGKMESIIEVGKEKKTNIEAYKKELEQLVGSEAPEKFLIKVRDEITKINKSYNEIKGELEVLKKEVKDLNDEVLKRKQDSLNLKESCFKLEDKISKLLSENDFINIEYCKEAYISEENIKILEYNIKDFEEQVNSILGNIKRISEKLNENFVDKEEILKLENYKKSIENQLNEKVTERIELTKEIKDLEKDLEHFKKLKKEEKVIEHKLSLINDIDKLFQGNKFVEFVAMNRLRYIAFEASKRLKEITCNRYSLEIDGDGNFTIRDDMNGGVIRDCSTLSGGETFLTSLALALSLSSQIQLKGSAPLEFFFLDEGFGTLDSKLLEIVISSLEKLQNDKMAVGIISHVEELKNRVPMKLIVEPKVMGEGGTKVHIELN